MPIFDSLRRIQVLAVVISEAILFLSCSHQSGLTSSSGATGRDSTPISLDTISTLYVEADRHGSGSPSNPLGNIQSALDSASRNVAISRILVSVGEYREQLIIRQPIALSGGCDPGAGWVARPDSVSIIRAPGQTAPPSAIVISGVHGAVTLHQLAAFGPDANDSGGCSFGVYAIQNESVRFVECRIYSGSGLSGRNGTDGAPGIKGQNAQYAFPGISPVRGGAGGTGSTSYNPGGPGEQGFCADETQSGGAGCLAGFNGQQAPLGGATGAPGVNGSNADSGMQVRNSVLITILVGDGFAGSAGQNGCGGGGGCGGPSVFGNHGYAPGGNGGGGGAGGGGGLGGMFGQGGGSSIGILSSQSRIFLESCVVYVKMAGDGGRGGQGGPGGAGGLASGGLCVATCGTSGADGGQGGFGGSGGGGAGGWTIGVLAYSSPPVSWDEFTSISVPRPGRGGANGSGLSFAPDGQALMVLTR